jgi:cytochrome oxidase Cu insertion factor (SCO1/SenC/PrrC family)
MNKAIIFFLALLLLLCGGMSIWAGWKYARRPAEKELNQAPILKQFTLTERSGKKLHSAQLEGQVRVVNFFYSVCPSVCRQENRRVEELAKEFGPQGVKFVSITCDPANDTPAALAEYARQFDARPDQWYFVTGDLPYVRRVGAEMFQVAVDKQTHAPHLIVLDRWGNIRGRYHYEDAAQVARMKRKLSQLLAEEEPPPEEPTKMVRPVDADDDGLPDPPAADEAQE